MINSTVRDDSGIYEQMHVAPNSLAPIELIQIAFGCSEKKAATLLDNLSGDSFDKLAGLRKLDSDSVGNLTPKQQYQALAIMELAKRIYSPTLAAIPLESPEAAVSYLSSDLMWADVEKFAVLLLDVKNKPIGKKIISIGTATETLAHPRDIFGAAVKCGATRIIISHNHPSGSVDPSPEDIYLTKQVLSAAQVMGIPVLDHLILSQGSFHSLRQSTDLWESYPQGV